MKKLIPCLAAALLLSACAKDDTTEPEASMQVKVNAEDTKDAIKDTFDKAGDKIEEGAQKAKAKLEQAGDAIKDEYQDAKEKLDNDHDAKVKVEVKKD